MIKPVNYGKITENYRNLPENSPKNPKIFRRAEGCPRLRRKGDFSKFSMTGGFLADPPYVSL